MAVTSRTGDFAGLGRRLDLAWAVEIQPLTREKVVSYLEDSGPATASLAAALTADDELWEVLDAPFWLHVMALAYREEDAGAPRDHVTVDGRKELLRRYVIGLLKRGRRSRTDRHAPGDTVRTLSRIARLIPSGVSIGRAFKRTDTPEVHAAGATAGFLAMQLVGVGALLLPLARTFGLLPVLVIGAVPLVIIALASTAVPRPPAFVLLAGAAAGVAVNGLAWLLTPWLRTELESIPVSGMMRFSWTNPHQPGAIDIDLYGVMTEGQFRDFLAVYLMGLLALWTVILMFKPWQFLEDRPDDPDGFDGQEHPLLSVFCLAIPAAAVAWALATDVSATGPLGGIIATAFVLLIPSGFFTFAIAFVLVGAVSLLVAPHLRYSAVYKLYGRVPWRLREFLHQATGYRLLIRDEHGYRFPHSLLREYLANPGDGAAADQLGDQVAVQ